MTEIRERVEVTQADRDAAAELIWLTGIGPRQSLRQICDEIVAGVRDFDHGVKVLTRHRLAAISAVMQDIEAPSEGLVSAVQKVIWCNFEKARQSDEIRAILKAASQYRKEQSQNG